MRLFVLLALVIYVDAHGKFWLPKVIVIPSKRPVYHNTFHGYKGARVLNRGPVVTGSTYREPGLLRGAENVILSKTAAAGYESLGPQSPDGFLDTSIHTVGDGPRYAEINQDYKVLTPGPAVETGYELSTGYLGDGNKLHGPAKQIQGPKTSDEPAVAGFLDTSISAGKVPDYAETNQGYKVTSGYAGQTGSIVSKGYQGDGLTLHKGYAEQSKRYKLSGGQGPVGFMDTSIYASKVPDYTETNQGYKDTSGYAGHKGSILSEAYQGDGLTLHKGYVEQGEGYKLSEGPASVGYDAPTAYAAQGEGYKLSGGQDSVGYDVPTAYAAHGHGYKVSRGYTGEYQTGFTGGQTGYESSDYYNKVGGTKHTYVINRYFKVPPVYYNHGDIPIKRSYR